MRLLAIDLSSHAGYALFESEPGTVSKPIEFGTITTGKTVKEHGPFPQSYVIAAQAQIRLVMEVVLRLKPDAIVIEQTNLGKARYSQKMLEFLHAYLLQDFQEQLPAIPIYYISSSVWRKTVGSVATKEDKAANARLSKAKSLAKKSGTKLDKKSLGITGKVTKKHISVRWCNSTMGFDFGVSKNDIADAICLGAAFLMGAELCDGT